MPGSYLRALALICFVSTVAFPQQRTSPVPSPDSGIEGGRLLDVVSLIGDLSHVQGLELNSAHVWVTSVSVADHKAYLTQFNRATGAFERQLDLTDGPRFHPGGLSYNNGSLWVPVAEYKPNSSAVIVEIDARTFAIKKRLPVADHLGCVAANQDSLVAGNWGSQKLYVFDHEGHTLRVLDTPSLTQYQDLKFDDGYLVASGNLGAKGGSVTWFTWPELKPSRTLQSGVTDRGRPYTAEGMAVQGNDLYLLPEDGPTRMFHFVVQQP